MKRGFTLIELLVVIAIIGILSSVVLASLSSARAKGRDAKRIADIKQLQLALEMYYDANTSYPATLASVAPTYIGAIPVDPQGGGAYGFVQTGSGSGYVLGAILEGAGQGSVLASDYDGGQAITIGSTSTNCNANTTGTDEVVYCVVNTN